ncbi:MAG TPA: hypothetical protein DEP91_08565, partial [Sphingomonas bacterium]|nr:hypothetical protein [Sphingomonas bacterium]
GLADEGGANPVLAALASAAAFATGAIVPVAVAAIVPRETAVAAVFVAAVLMLAILGAIGARAGGSPVVRAVLRVTILGCAAMALTGLLGRVSGVLI